ncbi:hypothetical protein [Salinispora fenicalii]|uniref:hypothetical protein n=1 Tax=Salinispora fenicalii TaxID=1137263 RepID=UPI0004849A10|nr:hypothetical protein [Salinispora fenicalii]
MSRTPNWDAPGLHDTVLAGGITDLPEPYAHGYYRYQDGNAWTVADFSRQNLSMLLGAGGSISITRDLNVFFAALNAGPLLPAPLLAELRKPAGPIDYGLGVFGRIWVRRASSTTTTAGHPAATAR